MAIELSNIYSLSDFQRNTRRHVTNLKRSGSPAVLTVNGQAELVVQSADAHHELLDDQEILESIRSVSRSLEQSKRGEGRPMRQFLQNLGRKHRIKLSRE